MQQHLFVYGTLGPNKPNAHILEAIAGIWNKGSVKGLLKEAGWGAELGFPGLMLSPDGQTIDGYMGLDSSSSIWITNESSKVNAHQLRSEVDAILIGKNTLLVIENHYLGSIIQKRQFDTFYHEHPRTYSLMSFEKYLK